MVFFNKTFQSKQVNGKVFPLAGRRPEGLSFSRITNKSAKKPYIVLIFRPHKTHNKCLLTASHSYISFHVNLMAHSLNNLPQIKDNCERLMLSVHVKPVKKE